MKNILVCGETVFGIIGVKDGYVVEADKELEWMIGRPWKEVYCWNRIKSFTVG